MPHSIESNTIDTTQTHGDWRDDLFRDGYVVVKNVLSEEKSQLYINSMFSWLEKFPFGFDRNDSKTWTPEHLPTHMKGGMYHGYSVQHEKFIWEARQEPTVINTFAKLWNTKDLLVSFDGMNFTLPSSSHPPSSPWPHVDQSPSRKGLQCAQGILNLAPNGPQDGGLMVMKGSHRLNEKFFTSHPEVVARKTWGPADWFGFEEEEVNWFKERGCELVKVCAGAGDLILWDSRTVHYNVLPESMNPRALMYVCYTPARLAAPKDLEEKGRLFDERKGTTHWPHANIFANGEKKLRFGEIDAAERDRPFEEPVENETMLKLAGRLAY